MRAHSAGMIVLLATMTILAHAQDARPAYEVASIRLNTSTSDGSSSKGSRGQVVFTNQTMKRLIERAYTVKPIQVTGPGWMENVRFDIIAKYPPDTKDEDRSLMLRTLLEDRFKLTVHRELKDMPGYALTVARSGFRLQPVDPGAVEITTKGAREQVLTARKVSLAALADLIARNLGQMVVDRIGINGVYDFELRWNNDDADASPSLFTAVQETLGLRLQPQKVPVEIIAVDHVERDPGEN